MDEDELELDELEALLGLPVILDELTVDEDPEVAYHVGRSSDIDDEYGECPYHEQDAIDEWHRGRADADRHDIYSMRRGLPPDHYRDPD